MKRFEIVDNGDNFPYFRGPELVLPNDMFPDTLEVDYISALFQFSPPETPLYPLSAASFRTRWDLLLKRLGVPKSEKFLPAGVRGGGCVSAHNAGLDLTSLLS